METVIMLDSDLNLRKSDAIIHLVNLLVGCWRPLGWGVSLIPLGIRNYFYEQFAKNQYMQAKILRSLCNEYDFKCITIEMLYFHYLYHQCSQSSLVNILVARKYPSTPPFTLIFY
jgi:hypothetical protein